MIEHVRKVLIGQYEAAVCMMGECVEKCPREQWDGLIAKYPFWQVAYHTLCFTDLYLTRDEREFRMDIRPDGLHPRGWDELNEEYPSRRFEKAELLEYVGLCRRKAVETIAAETAESLAGPTGHSRRTFSRLELHIYNIRHVQHHAGQLSAFLRRAGVETGWVGSGWR